MEAPGASFEMSQAAKAVPVGGSRVAPQSTSVRGFNSKYATSTSRQLHHNNALQSLDTFADKLVHDSTRTSLGGLLVRAHACARAAARVWFTRPRAPQLLSAPLIILGYIGWYLSDFLNSGQMASSSAYSVSADLTTYTCVGGGGGGG